MLLTSLHKSPLKIILVHIEPLDGEFLVPLEPEEVDIQCWKEISRHLGEAHFPELRSLELMVPKDCIEGWERRLRRVLSAMDKRGVLKFVGALIHSALAHI
jgi:hypothetical protein